MADEHPSRKPKGWSAFTHLHHHPSLSSAHAQKTLAMAEEHPHPSPASNSLPQTFSHVVKQSLTTPLPVVVSRLQNSHRWADESLVIDLLQSLDLDEDRTSAYLFAMSESNSERISPSNDDQASPASCPDDQVCNPPDGQLAAADNSSPFDSVPMEPEWEDDDIYHATRKDALKVSRAREKHALGAYKAFMNGDYSRAKLLSKKAREERVEAERLHAEAAKQIFQIRNSDAHRTVWELDLHGLHAGEAVAALSQRLSEIETALPIKTSSREPSASSLLRTDRQSNSSSVFQSAIATPQNYQQTNERPGLLTGGLPFRPELKVVTGVGNHSRGGVSLPRAIKGFLLQNGYKFEESRSGMITVHPKFCLMKDK